MNDEFYDLVYDVWMSGGNPDAVDGDRFEYEHDGHYDFVFDGYILQNELEHQRPEPKETTDETDN